MSETLSNKTKQNARNTNKTNKRNEANKNLTETLNRMGIRHRKCRLKNFFEFHDEFVQNRTQLELNVFNHLVKRCAFKIDEHRREAKTENR